MAEKIALEFTIGDGPAIKSMGDLKRQLKEAQFEALALSEKFGATSEEAINAANKVAKLKDAVGDAKDLVESFNPDAKFKAFGGALQGVAGGFAAVQGAMGLLGSESEAVQQTLLKVQSAMAISEGLNSVMASIDQFKNLGAVIKATTIFKKADTAATIVATTVMKLFGKSAQETATGFKILKGAIAATGIGLLVMGLTTLISKIGDWIGGSDDAEKAQAALNKQIEEQNRLLSESQSKLNYERQLYEKRAKIQGTSQADILKQTVEFNKQDVSLLEKHLNDQRAMYNQMKEGDAEEYKKYLQDFDATKEKIVEAKRKVALSELDIQINAKEETDKINKEKEDKDKAAKEKAIEKQKQYAEKIKEANKTAREEISKLEEENYLKSIKDDDERAQEKLRLDYQRKKKEIEQSVASEKLKNEQIKLITDQFFLDQQTLKEEQDKKKSEQIDKDIQDEIDRLDKLNEIDLKAKKDKADEELKIEETKNAALQTLQNAYGDSILAGIGIIKQFGEKNKAIQKAALVAENAITIAKIILDTQKANAAVTAKYALVPGGQIPAAAEILANKIKAGIGIATAIAATAKGLQGIGGGGGGASASGGGQSLGGNEGGQQAPVAPALSSTALNQQMINSLNSATNRAFVLESDISGNQERIQRLNRAARIS